MNPKYYIGLTSKFQGKNEIRFTAVSRIKQLILLSKTDEHFKKGQILLLVCSKFEHPFEIR